VREKQHSITPKNSAQEPLDVSSAGDFVAQQYGRRESGGW
jgi:hypothetical protein